MVPNQFYEEGGEIHRISSCKRSPLDRSYAYADAESESYADAESESYTDAESEPYTDAESDSGKDSDGKSKSDSGTGSDGKSKPGSGKKADCDAGSYSDQIRLSGDYHVGATSNDNTDAGSVYRTG